MTTIKDIDSHSGWKLKGFEDMYLTFHTTANYTLQAELENVQPHAPPVLTFFQLG